MALLGTACFLSTERLEKNVQNFLFEIIEVEDNLAKLIKF